MDVGVVGTGEAVPQQAPPLPQGGQPAAPHSVLMDAPHVENTGALSPVVAKIFGGGDIPKPVTVNVSYRVEHDPNMVVMVFTDPQTGQEIAQVPREVMVQIAQFFDKQSGVTLDRSA